ncbi:MAG: glycosyltransferase family 2 protein [Gammaproteobacteria bacterium]|nr:glycosyltransferase family 2 protein [Gammaproteobacteria bacterium]
MNISIVIPLLNEAPNLRPLHEEVTDVMTNTGLDYEIIFVDDGSDDESLDILKEIQAGDSHVKIVSFRRNFGQTAALAAGFEYAQGDVFITMDADRQNDPRDIPEILEKIDEGYDLVNGWRFDRQDDYLSRKLPSMIANKLISWTTDVKLHDYGCTLKAIRSEVAKHIMLYGELHRFIPAIASWMGVNIAEVRVNHRPRVEGDSKYGISRTFRVFLDLITVKFMLSYSGRPIHFFGIPGLLTSVIGFIIAFYLSVERIFFGVALSDRPILLLAILLILIGVQFIVFGLLGELQIRTYHESQNKPIFVTKELVGFEN